MNTYDADVFSVLFQNNIEINEENMKEATKINLKFSRYFHNHKVSSTPDKVARQAVKYYFGCNKAMITPDNMKLIIHVFGDTIRLMTPKAINENTYYEDRCFSYQEQRSV